MVAYTALAGINALASIQGGKSAQRAYDRQARSVELQAKAEKINRMTALNKALAMQNLMAGASGSMAGEGSAKTLVDESIRGYEQDVAGIVSKGRVRASGLRRAGSQARSSGISSGLIGAAKDAVAYKSVG